MDVYHSISGVRFAPKLKKKHLLSSAAGLLPFHPEVSIEIEAKSLDQTGQRKPGYLFDY